MAFHIALIGGTTNASSTTAAVTSIEVFDGTNITLANSLPNGLDYPSAVTLDSGLILIGGGRNGSGTIVQQCYLYDPVNNVVSTTGSLPGATVSRSTATGQAPSVSCFCKLTDGRVLALGQIGSKACYIYDPDTETWSTKTAPGAVASNVLLGLQATDDGNAISIWGTNAGRPIWYKYNVAGDSWTNNFVTTDVSIFITTGSSWCRLIKFVDGTFYLYIVANRRVFQGDTLGTTWTLKTQGPALGNVNQGLAADDFIYSGQVAVSGSQTYRYDRNADTYTQLADGPIIVSSTDPAATEPTAPFVEYEPGFLFSPRLDSTYIYSIADDVWTQGPDRVTPTIEGTSSAFVVFETIDPASAAVNGIIRRGPWRRRPIRGTLLF